MSIVAYGLRGEGYSVADWGGGMSAGCAAGPSVRCGIISSCQSAATSEIVKRFWSRV